MDAFRKIRGWVLVGLILIGVGFLITDRISSGYAIATVNGTEISYADWKTFREAFEEYRANLLKQEGNAEVMRALKDLTAEEIDRMTLEQMIGHTVLHEHLTKEFGLRAEDMVRAGFKKARAGESPDNATEEVPVSTFDRLVLIPQVERTVASELVRASGGDFSTWTRGHLAEATVSVRWYTYKWENGALKKK